MKTGATLGRVKAGENKKGGRRRGDIKGVAARRQESAMGGAKEGKKNWVTKGKKGKSEEKEETRTGGIEIICGGPLHDHWSGRCTGKGSGRRGLGEGSPPVGKRISG